MFGVVFDRDFGQVIMDGYSAVKISDDLDRKSQEVVETVQWTAKLDRAFNHNRVADPNIRYGIILFQRKI